MQQMGSQGQKNEVHVGRRVRNTYLRRQTAGRAESVAVHFASVPSACPACSWRNQRAKASSATPWPASSTAELLSSKSVPPACTDRRVRACGRRRAHPHMSQDVASATGRNKPAQTPSTLLLQHVCELCWPFRAPQGSSRRQAERARSPIGCDDAPGAHRAACRAGPGGP